jgi:hypothetical protein
MHAAEDPLDAQLALALNRRLPGGSSKTEPPLSYPDGEPALPVGAMPPP